ncbi:uncharacterized protein N7498_007387 [Penicillium cinerascens]|uniref:Uncharacterized protein n=1 Tax=Penicillium cinerascens TaxID=70096 RepID=A0A9W9JNP8_9EURO|nr:uncharacterized protein N7498_007387 [Penicillium cinerascens]KAJ5198270.1 hypothetical protein N7498_007387 [Penicillium cinerascens]
MAPEDFKGKLAIVTGASKHNGIGFATAYALARAGADRSAGKIRDLGVKVIAVQADAGSLTFGDDIVRATVEAFPGRQIDIVVNNAGFGTFQESTAEAVVEDFDALFHVNVRGPHLLVRAALPYIASPGGRVVNVSSVVARTGAKQAALYSSSKGALNTLTLAWAEELGDKGITVNVVSPGPIGTDYAAPEEPPLIQKFRAQQYAKRDGTTEEVANVILFAASAGASYMSGQVLAVDGGLSYV